MYNTWNAGKEGSNTVSTAAAGQKVRAQHQYQGPPTSGNTSSPVQRQVFQPSGSGLRGSSTPRSPSIQPHCNEDRLTDSHGRSSHVQTRQGESSRDRGNEQRLHV